MFLLCVCALLTRNLFAIAKFLGSTSEHLTHTMPSIFSTILTVLIKNFDRDLDP